MFFREVKAGRVASNAAKKRVPSDAATTVPSDAAPWGSSPTVSVVVRDTVQACQLFVSSIQTQSKPLAALS